MTFPRNIFRLEIEFKIKPTEDSDREIKGIVDLKNFAQLEIRIEKLIKQNISLREQNKILSENLAKNDQGIQILNNTIAKLKEEKDVVYTKIEGLIKKLEAIDESC